jgi:hypothetical protein
MILRDDYGEASRMLLSSKKLKQNKIYYYYYSVLIFFKYKNNITIAIWHCYVVRSAGGVLQRTYTTSPTLRPSGDMRARKALSTPLHVRCFHTLLFTFNSCT